MRSAPRIVVDRRRGAAEAPCGLGKPPRSQAALGQRGHERAHANAIEAPVRVARIGNRRHAGGGRERASSERGTSSSGRASAKPSNVPVSWNGREAVNARAARQPEQERLGLVVLVVRRHDGVTADIPRRGRKACIPDTPRPILQVPAGLPCRRLHDPPRQAELFGIGRHEARLSAASGRRPWSTVTTSAGGRPLQRATSTMSAVESGPPETANTEPARAREAREQPARIERCGVSSRCAPTRHQLGSSAQARRPDICGRPRQAWRRRRPFRRARRATSRAWSARRDPWCCARPSCNGEERVCRVAILALLEMALAQPELGVGGLRVAREGREPVAEALLRKTVVAGQDVP